LRGRAIAAMTNLPFCVSNAAITELALRRSLAVRMSSRGERVKSLPHPCARRAGLGAGENARPVAATLEHPVRKHSEKRVARISDYAFRIAQASLLLHRMRSPLVQRAPTPRNPFFPFVGDKKSSGGGERRKAAGRGGTVGRVHPVFRRGDVTKQASAEKKFTAGRNNDATAQLVKRGRVAD